MKKEIKGGFYLKARCIQDSAIAHAPPHVREIWDWLLKEANHKSIKTHGSTIERGQLFTTYKEIQDGLCWFVGYRKETYEKWHCEKAMKYLVKEGMIATTKTTRGLIVTICNYDTYQNVKNYESYTKDDTIATTGLQPTDTINKNDNNVIKKEEENAEASAPATHKLAMHVQINFPNICKIKNQLTDAECERLVAEFKPDDIKAVLQDMENHKDLPKKYTSVNLTLRKWLKLARERKSGGSALIHTANGVVAPPLDLR